jgi:VIT1/CCC1 family predicted Fe2+/Mn2+ transporter
VDRHPQRYLNGVSVGLSVLIGAVVTALVLPTSGEAVSTGSALLWTAVFALLIGGITFESFLSNRAELVGDAVPE